MKKEVIYVRDQDWTLEPIDELTSDELESHQLMMSEGVIEETGPGYEKVFGAIKTKPRSINIKRAAKKENTVLKKLKSR